MVYHRRRGRRGRRVKRRRPTLARKRTVRYKKNFMRKNMSVVPQLGIADSVFVKLRYVDRITTSTSGLTVVTPVQFRGNGPYDPAVATGGASCDYYDAYSGLYSSYICYASKIRVTLMQQSSTVTSNIVWGVTAAPSSISYSSATYPTVQAYKYTRSKITGTSSNGNTVQTIKYYMPANVVFGVPKRRISDNNVYASAIDSFPNTQWYWTLWSQCQDETSNISSIADVKITYYIKFYAPSFSF